MTQDWSQLIKDLVKWGVTPKAIAREAKLSTNQIKNYRDGTNKKDPPYSVAQKLLELHAKITK